MDATDEDMNSESLGEVASAQAKDTTGTPTGPCTVISGANEGKRARTTQTATARATGGISECEDQDGINSGKVRRGTSSSGLRTGAAARV